MTRVPGSEDGTTTSLCGAGSGALVGCEPAREEPGERVVAVWEPTVDGLDDERRVVVATLPAVVVAEVAGARVVVARVVAVGAVVAAVVVWTAVVAAAVAVRVVVETVAVSGLCRPASTSADHMPANAKQASGSSVRRLTDPYPRYEVCNRRT